MEWTTLRLSGSDGFLPLMTERRPAASSISVMVEMEYSPVAYQLKAIWMSGARSSSTMAIAPDGVARVTDANGSVVPFAPIGIDLARYSEDGCQNHTRTTQCVNDEAHLAEDVIKFDLPV